MSDKLRTMIREFNDIQQISKQLPSLRKNLVSQIKSEGLTKNKFKLSNSKTISYHKYSRPADLSLTMVQDSIKELYPNMDVKLIMEHINKKRNARRSTTETIRTKIITSPK